MKNRFFVWVLPVVWATCSLFSYHFPGDEYALYVISSIAGVWVWFFIHTGDVHDIFFPGSIAFIGAIIMAVLGFLMDRLRIRRAMWAAFFLAATVVVFVTSVRAYPTIDKALSKNGSWWAYIFFSINMGLYFGIILSLICKGLGSAWRRIASTNQSNAAC